MKAPITETAEAFTRHQFDATYPFILDEAEWMLVGGRRMRGKADILRVITFGVMRHLRIRRRKHRRHHLTHG
jgi:hypothetical protein